MRFIDKTLFWHNYKVICESAKNRRQFEKLMFAFSHMSEGLFYYKALNIRVELLLSLWT